MYPAERQARLGTAVPTGRKPLPHMATHVDSQNICPRRCFSSEEKKGLCTPDPPQDGVISVIKQRLGVK